MVNQSPGGCLRMVICNINGAVPNVIATSVLVHTHLGAAKVELFATVTVKGHRRMSSLMKVY